MEPTTGPWAEKRRLAAAMRRVIGELVVTDAPEADLRAAADALKGFAESLAGHPKRSRLEGFAETAVAGDVEAFFDQSPLVGLSNPLAPPITLKAEGKRVSAKVVFGAAYEGPPGHVHGGFIAAAFDDVLGFAQSVTGQPGMTAQLSVGYRLPTPLHTPLLFKAGVDRVSGRKTFASGSLMAGEKVTAEAEALFISVDRERFAAFIEAAKVGGGS